MRTASAGAYLLPVITDFRQAGTRLSRFYAGGAADHTHRPYGSAYHGPQGQSVKRGWFVRRDSLAFRSRAGFGDTTEGADKRIFVPAPLPGRWFVGVECVTTVETYGDSIFLYRGRTDVLDGVAHTIAASRRPGCTFCGAVQRHRRGWSWCGS